QYKTAEEKKWIPIPPYKAINLVAVLLNTWRRIEKHIALHWQIPLRKNVQVEIKSPIAIPLPERKMAGFVIAMEICAMSIYCSLTLQIPVNLLLLKMTLFRRSWKKH